MTNDYGYDVTYQKLLENFSNENDCLIAISSSGNSKNIINATERFRELNPKGKGTISKKKLDMKGFNFNYITEVYTTKVGKVYFFCYDQGYSVLENEMYMLVKKD